MKRFLLYGQFIDILGWLAAGFGRRAEETNKRVMYGSLPNSLSADFSWCAARTTISELHNTSSNSVTYGLRLVYRSAAGTKTGFREWTSSR